MKIGIFSGIFLGLCAISACATQQNQTTESRIFFDPETGTVTTSEGASEEAKALATMMADAFEATKEAEALNEDEIFEIDSDDNYTHIQSGFICPKVWSGFTRQDTQIYKPAGNDIGCTYTDEVGSLVSFYAYSYSNLSSLEDELNEVMESVVKVRHPVSKEASVIVAQSPRGNQFGYVGDAITFETTDGEVVKSGLFLADAGPWRLKVRVTYAEVVSSVIETFAGASLQGQWDRVMRQSLSNDDAPDSAPLPMPGEEVDT